MKEFIEEIKKTSDELISGRSEEKKERAVKAYQRFNEYLLRLDIRFIELVGVEQSITEIGHTDKVDHGFTLDELQLQFLDKTESFHQHVYAALSAFVMLLSYVMDDRQSSQLPINSVERFIGWISKNTYDSVIKDSAHILSRSVDFRSKFIDHSQQHALHDWMTFAHGDGSAVVYFIPKSNKVIYRGFHDNPYSPDFEPPVDYSSFYVTPPYKLVKRAIKDFTLRNLRQNQGSNTAKQ